MGYSGDPDNNTPIKAMRNPTMWDMRPDQENPDTMRCVLRPRLSRLAILCLLERRSADRGDRAYVAGTDYCLDLSGHGNSNPGTPVTLWKKWGGANQTWRFEQGEFFLCAFASRPPDCGDAYMCSPRLSLAQSSLCRRCSHRVDPR